MTTKSKILHWLITVILIPLLAGTSNVAIAETTTDEPPFTSQQQANIRMFRERELKDNDVNAVDENGRTFLHRMASYMADTGFRGVEITRFLVAEGADIHAKDNYGSTPLHAAVRRTEFGRSGSLEPLTAQFLVSKGADIHAKDDVVGWTPLHAAVLESPRSWRVSASTIGTVKFLLSAGADVNVKSNAGLTPLHLAAYANGNSLVAVFLLSEGADVNAKDEHGRTPLHWAAINRNAGEAHAALFVLKGADAHARGNDGLTPLDLAKRRENTAVIEYLSGLPTPPPQPNQAPAVATAQTEIDMFRAMYGSDVKAVDGDGLISLFHAIHAVGHGRIDYWDIEVIKFLVSEGADVNASTSADYQTLAGWAPLHQATTYRDIEVIRYLVSQGADVNTDTLYGRGTPLRAAVRRNDIEMVQLLVSAGADVNAGKHYWNAHLVHAVHTHNLEIVQFLVSKGADVNAVGDRNRRSSPGHTPLTAAVAHNNMDIIEFLLSKGADVNLQGSDYTPAHTAAGMGNIDLLKFLMSKGADIKARGGNGETLLHCASLWDGHLAMVQFLVSEGLDVNAKDNRGDTPLDWAKRDNSVEEPQPMIIEFLSGIQASTANE